jgi:hypothetical protein
MSPAERRLVELTAKVTFNEALDSAPDRYLIWQIIEGHGGTAEERVRWLTSHSPCVSGRLTQDEAQARPGNCAWTRNARADGRLPRGWPHSQAAWHRMRPRWLAHLEAVRALVSGEDTYRPCRTTPTSWDGDRPLWRARAEARGYVEVECEGAARNVGYRLAGAS